MARFLFILFLFISSPAHAEFRFRIVEDLGTLDWSYGEVNSVVVQQLMEGLTTSGKNGEAVPAIAKRWNRTGNTYVFELRKDAKWSDGVSVCAQHFVDGWQRVLSAELASPFAHYFHLVKNLKAEGCHILRVELKKPASYFAALTSHWVFLPVRLDLIKKYGKDWFKPGKLVVTGPYELSEWKPDKYFLLKKNATYFANAQIKDAEEYLRAVVVSDDSTAITLFQKKELDWIRDIPFLEKPRLSQSPEYRTFRSFVEYHLGFRFGQSGDLTRDERCALASALDKKQIPMFLKGGETPADRLVPQMSFEPKLKSTLKHLDRQLNVYYYSKDIHEPLMQWIQEEWRKKLGAKVNLKKMEGKSYWSKLQRDPPEIFLSGITAAYAHPFSFLSEFLSESRANWGGFKSDAYDKAALQDQTEKAQRILLEQECAVVPLYFRQTSALVSGRWQGFFLNPLTYVYLKSVHRQGP